MTEKIGKMPRNKVLIHLSLVFRKHITVSGHQTAQ
jgi:hypothetical protein